MFNKEDKLNKIIKYGLYLFAFLLPLQTRWIIKAGMINEGYFEYVTISLYGTDMVLIFLISLFIYFNLKKSKQVQSSGSKGLPVSRQVQGYWYLIAGLDLFIFISIFLAPNKLLAGYRYVLFLLGVGLFWLITKANYDKIKLYYFVLVGIFLQACLGIWQFLSQSSFANKWLGLAIHNPAELGVSVVEIPATIINLGERWLRAYGGFDHPNILGGTLAIGIILAVYLITKNLKSPKFLNKFEFFNFKFIHHTLYIMLYTFIAALFFTFSRGAWIAAIMGVLMVLFGHIIRRDLIAQKETLIVILISCFLIGVLFFQYNDLITTRLSNNTRLEIKSSMERVASYHEAWQIIKNHPLFGAGLGNYTLAVHEELQPKELNWYYQPVHNVFLLIWSEIGLFGIVFFVLLLLSIMIKNLKLKIQSSRSNYFFISILVSILIMMFVDHWLWSLHFGILFFWLILGLIVKSSDCQKLPEEVK